MYDYDEADPVANCCGQLECNCACDDEQPYRHPVTGEVRRLRDVPPELRGRLLYDGLEDGEGYDDEDQLAGNVEHHDAYDHRAPAGVEDDAGLYDDDDEDDADEPLPPAGMGLTRRDAEAYNRLAANREFYAGYDEGDVLYHPDVRPADGLLVPTINNFDGAAFDPDPQGPLDTLRLTYDRQDREQLYAGAGLTVNGFEQIDALPPPPPTVAHVAEATRNARLGRGRQLDLLGRQRRQRAVADERKGHALFPTPPLL